MFDAWISPILQWLELHPHFILLALGLIGLVECIAFVGLFLPGTAILLALSTLAAHSGVSLWSSALVVSAGSLMGDLLSYQVGRSQGTHLANWSILRKHPTWLPLAQQFFQKYGIPSLLIGKFIGPVRPLLPITAGSLQLRPSVFFIISVISSLGWPLMVVVPGWLVGNALNTDLPLRFWGELAAAGSVFALLYSLNGFWLYKGGKRHHSQVAAFSLIALIALVFTWPHLAQLDVQTTALLQRHRHAELDQVMLFITGLGDFNTLLITSLAISAWLFWHGLRRTSLFFISSVWGTAVLNQALKVSIARARPEVIDTALNNFSFPSGHTSAATAFALALAVTFSRGQPTQRRLWIISATLLPALAVACSRVYLGAHWLTDVFGGVLLATTATACILWLCERKTPLPELPTQQRKPLLAIALLLLISVSTWNLLHNNALYAYSAL